MSQIKFTPPTKQTPGFLRRQKKALALGRKLKAEPGPEVVDEIVEFLLPYVVEPTDREQAADALMDATEEQFEMLLEQVGGQKKDPLAESGNS